MHHEDIKAAIRKKGVTPSQLARHLKVTDQIVSAVIRGTTKSARIATAISQIVGVPIEVLWPGKYDKSRASTKVQQLLRSLAAPGDRRAAPPAPHTPERLKSLRRPT